jgi:hypothetical protein
LNLPPPLNRGQKAVGQEGVHKNAITTFAVDDTKKVKKMTKKAMLMIF